MHAADMERLYRDYAPVVYKYLYCLTREVALAEDLTSETFARAFARAGQFRGDCKLSVWLCSIAKRLFYDEMRKRKRAQTVQLNETELIGAQDIERELIGREDRIALYRALHALEEPAREVLYLRLIGDMTFDEIGEILGKSGNWARVTYYRGKETLKRRMQ